MIREVLDAASTHANEGIGGAMRASCGGNNRQGHPQHEHITSFP